MRMLNQEFIPTISDKIYLDYLGFKVGWDKANREIQKALDHKSDPRTDSFFYCDHCKSLKRGTVVSYSAENMYACLSCFEKNVTLSQDELDLTAEATFREKPNMTMS